MDPLRLDRLPLYEAVWSTPLSHLAKRWGVSSTQVVDACQKLNVPRPASGHWTRLALGQVLPPTPLPEHPDGVTTVVLHPRPPRPEKSTASNRPVVDTTEGQPESELVISTRAALQHGGVQANGAASPAKNRRHLATHVTPERIPRALRIWDVLIHSAPSVEARIEVVRADNGRYDTRALIDGESIGILLEEDIRRREKPQPEGDPTERLLARFYLRQEDRYTYEPTGKLVLRLQGLERTGARQNFEDSPTQKLESKLGDALEAIRAGAGAIKERRAEGERQRQRWKEEEASRADRARRQREEEEQASQLFQMKKHWKAAQDLRAFVGAVETLVTPELRDDPWNEWLQWAHRYADAIDPLKTPEKAKRLLLKPDRQTWYTDAQLGVGGPSTHKPWPVGGY